ncbi:hypothetical protein QBC32DRAFT_270226 [Pseudoneurospora amorphoporcata]|uniref:NACHT-NTPase and P-loop NTPases N-terminal domain-containing protein n=1 Tax=Pseudoneurospora amorphoporcata TaxID=241081 RepID=A0AAN6NMC4_9PEZI|nr:hypothetical protein QBC32DRAFT_270226 [Pseudoneurospora amorphoporcata]
MSAVEVVSLLSTIISIVSAAIDLYDAYQDINGLPDVVKYALAQFHFVKDTLETVRNDVDEHRRNPNPKSYQAMKEILRSCEAKISSLDKIFSAIIPRPQKDTKTQPSFRQRFSRFTSAVSFTFNRGKKVEYLMKGVRQDIKLLAYNRILSPATRDQIKDTTERELGVPGLPSLPLSYLRHVRSSQDVAAGQTFDTRIQALATSEATAIQADRIQPPGPSLVRWHSAMARTFKQ